MLCGETLQDGIRVKWGVVSDSGEVRGLEVEQREDEEIA